MLLDYSRYKELGGSVSTEVFPPLALKAQLLLNEWCSGRLEGYSQSDAVDLALTYMVDALSENNGQRLTSFSNGVNSFSFADDGRNELYRSVCEILPAELTCLAVD